MDEATDTEKLLAIEEINCVKSRGIGQRFNGDIFYTLAEARILIEAWRRHNNTVRPLVSCQDLKCSVPASPYRATRRGSPIWSRQPYRRRPHFSRNFGNRPQACAGTPEIQDHPGRPDKYMAYWRE
jgi:hypothetical protein